MIRIYSVDLRKFENSDFEEEYSRIDAIAHRRLKEMKESDRRQTLAGRILLRRGIFELFGLKEYNITYNPNGKPELDFCHFSISHSGDLVICAIADVPIGIDIEPIKEMRKAKHYPFFTADEAERINCSQNPSDMFLRLWTQKEAYVKMKGGTMLKDGKIDIGTVEDVDLKTEINGNYMISTCISVR